ncbi:uncharacterized protein MYCFIDRAFT_178467 [Pseudocercospora fijiensis CIRAD86]|uniref:Uncharacterized protein n=1 Tax=Pseudocercospora fijiensis (strain CIRAD86) TaxID=383855 RepID=M3ALK6_PSEFD|nr:uncharacterized protein MYCFIDRAFT_178467 [Pseudocercospora fijiensis CIRAD86]EME78317.1 hypothetical protein MYCFIDRAFT_178467 [Pseudocercospora fijiensis CIRAD86]
MREGNALLEALVSQCKRYKGGLFIHLPWEVGVSGPCAAVKPVELACCRNIAHIAKITLSPFRTGDAALSETLQTPSRSIDTHPSSPSIRYSLFISTRYTQRIQDDIRLQQWESSSWLGSKTAFYTESLRAMFKTLSILESITLGGCDGAEGNIHGASTCGLGLTIEQDQAAFKDYKTEQGVTKERKHLHEMIQPVIEEVWDFHQEPSSLLWPTRQGGHPRTVTESRDCNAISAGDFQHHLNPNQVGERRRLRLASPPHLNLLTSPHPIPSIYIQPTTPLRSVPLLSTPSPSPLVTLPNLIPRLNRPTGSRRPTSLGNRPLKVTIQIMKTCHERNPPITTISRTGFDIPDSQPIVVDFPEHVDSSMAPAVVAADAELVLGVTPVVFFAADVVGGGVALLLLLDDDGGGGIVLGSGQGLADEEEWCDEGLIVVWEI